MVKKIKQYDLSDCGAAALASIAAHYQLYVPLARIRQLAGTDRKGTNLYGLINAAEKLGFTAKGVRVAEENLNKVPLPAVGHIVLKNGLHHYVVVDKVGKRKVRFMDPATASFKKVKLAQWTTISSGIMLLLAPTKDFIPGKKSKSTLRRFHALVRPHRRIIWQSIAGALAYTLLGLSTAIYLQKVTDLVLSQGNRNLLNLLSVVVLGLLVMQAILGYFKSMYILKTGQRIDAQLILGYYRHLLTLPQRFFDTMRVGEILSRIGDAVKIRVFLNDMAVNLLVNVFVVVFSFLLMFTYYWKLALALSIIVPCYLLIYLLTDRFNSKRERVLMEKSADLEAHFVESLNAVRLIKQFGLEEYNRRRTQHRFGAVLKAVFHSGQTSINSDSVTELISRAFTIFLLWGGSLLVMDQLITPGELLSFYALFGYFTGPANSLVGMNKTLRNALIAADRLFEILDLEGEESTGKIDLTREMLGNIQFRSVSFAYGPRKQIFESLNLEIEHGHFTGIVGASGSGKSSISALLQKLYLIDSGRVTIGDHDIGSISASSLRRQIAVVPQDLQLLSATVLGNITLGDPSPDISRVFSICKDLEILDFIEQLPHGFQYRLEENGSNLSGGQRQKLAIARALYRSPGILILDEATSALDTVAEFALQRLLVRLREEGMTIIVIAHRLSTVVPADKILVMQEGGLVEQGTHRELLALEGHYSRLWKQKSIN